VGVAAPVVLEGDGPLDEALEEGHRGLGRAAPDHLERLVGVEEAPGRVEAAELREGEPEVVRDRGHGPS
jgi:hypothetical protein